MRDGNSAFWRRTRHIVTCWTPLRPIDSRAAIGEVWLDNLGKECGTPCQATTGNGHRRQLETPRPRSQLSASWVASEPLVPVNRKGDHTSPSGLWSVWATRSVVQAIESGDGP